ncbi:MAG: HTH-type transcriptional regulator CysL [Kerstersia gyiorum]|uniref:LysR family transcriptional regulator n=1 Tax=Kerstersia gyiorum TaxID=206506 RepID=UPI0030CECB82
MDIYQLRTFLAVAREGSITRAADQLFLSQPAISAHIKSLEEELELLLFERTPRGMSLTPAGVSLYTRAEQLLALHHDMLDEARRLRGTLNGRLRLGLTSAASEPVLGPLLGALAARYPAVELDLQYATSVEILQGIRNGTLDAGILADAGVPDTNLARIELYRFGIFLAAAPGLVAHAAPPDWQELARQPWICPGPSTCCGLAAEHVFQTYGFRPGRLFNADHENTSRALITGGIGLGFLHETTARAAEAAGEVELIGGQAQHQACMVFAWQAHRNGEALLGAAIETVHGLKAEGHWGDA